MIETVWRGQIASVSPKFAARETASWVEAGSGFVKRISFLASGIARGHHCSWLKKLCLRP